MDRRRAKIGVGAFGCELARARCPSKSCAGADPQAPKNVDFHEILRLSRQRFHLCGASQSGGDALRLNLRCRLLALPAPGHHVFIAFVALCTKVTTGVADEGKASIRPRREARRARQEVSRGSDDLSRSSGGVISGRTLIRRTRALHYVGTSLAVASLALAAGQWDWRWLVAAPLVGYAFALGGPSRVREKPARDLRPSASGRSSAIFVCWACSCPAGWAGNCAEKSDDDGAADRL